MRKKVLDSVRIAALLLVFAVCLMIGIVAVAAGKPYVPDGDGGWHFRM